MNGPAVGLGCTYALLCDIVVMSRDARIGDPHINVGLVPGDGGMALIPALIGLNKARELLMTGDLIDGAAILRLLAHTAATPKDVIARYNAIGGERK